MKDKIKNISIVIVTYNSSKKLVKLIKKIPHQSPILIVDNSNDQKLIKNFNKNKNISIYFKKNDGYGSSINYAAKKIKTEYFFVIQPDVSGIDKNAIITFYDYAKKLKNKFSVIGPHFLKTPKSGHYQTNLKYRIKQIHNVHGSTMFFNKSNFIKNKGFDKNIFLYWEETDYTKRALKIGFPAYQLNKVKVYHEKGKAVELKDSKEEQKLNILYSWHFIWSKFYFFKKHYGKFFATLYFIPMIIRIYFRIFVCSLIKSNKLNKYKYRLNGLKTSIFEKKSSLRLGQINLEN